MIYSSTRGLHAADLNDDTVGRVLDRLFDKGCTGLFCNVASVATRIAAVDRKFGHLDTTTFSVYGDYESSEEEGAAIHVTHGHSKQKRPDLKQIFLNLLVFSDGGIPLFMQALDGNSSDVTTFRTTVTEFRRGLRENLKEITYWVADSSFYSETTLKEVRNDLSWISRVPGRINEAKKLVKTTALLLLEAEPVPLVPLQEEGYSYRKYRSMYGGVEQRWFIIHSVQAETRAIHAVKRAVEKERDQIRLLMKRLQKKEYGSEEEAEHSLQILHEKAKFHNFAIVQVKEEVKYKQRGRPARNKTDDKNRTVHYRAEHSVTVNPRAVNLEVKKRSLFIVATNELSSEKLNDQEVIENYKGQKHVEKGFRFLKDPLFFASSLFLKKPERIVSLTMVMCLSLLVYSIGERKLRKLLKEQGKTIRNQVKKAT